jgi:hypothetical protein
MQKAAAKNPKQNPIDFVREEVVSVYPDTLAWMKGFRILAERTNVYRIFLA